MKSSRPAWWPVALLLAALAATSAPLPAADGPTPYPDPKNEAAWPGKGPIRQFGWMVDNRKTFWANREKAQGAVVFVGDSLTGNWKPEVMAQQFPGLKIANRGIGGDVSRGVLFRLREDVLDLKPRAVVLCIGTNDLSAHADPAGVEQNLAAILAQIREAGPSVPIILSQIPPRDAPKSPTKPGAFADLNARIVKLAQGQDKVALIDLAPAVTTPDGKLVPECFAADRVHLAAPAYEKWASLIRPALEKFGVK